MQLDDMIKQLAENAQSFKQLTVGYSDADAQWQPDSDTWSVLMVVDHMWREERGDFRARLAAGLGLPNPSGPQEQEPFGTLSECLAAFLDERAQSLGWLRGLKNPNWWAMCSIEVAEISAGDMVAAWAAHDTLHLRQLVELRFAHIVKLAQPYSVRYAGEW